MKHYFIVDKVISNNCYLANKLIFKGGLKDISQNALRIFKINIKLPTPIIFSSHPWEKPNKGRLKINYSRSEGFNSNFGVGIIIRIIWEDFSGQFLKVCFIFQFMKFKLKLSRRVKFFVLKRIIITLILRLIQKSFSIFFLPIKKLSPGELKTSSKTQNIFFKMFNFPSIIVKEMWTRLLSCYLDMVFLKDALTVFQI